MRIRTHAILVVGALALAGAGVEARQSPDASAIPKESKRALDDAFDKWEAAGIHPQSVACRRDAAAPAAQASGDFNNDGQSDLAMLVKTADGVHLAVIFQRVTEHVVVDADRVGETAADGWIAVEPRGAGYLNTADGLEDFLSADTVVFVRCGQPRTAYFWSGLGFRKAPLPEEEVTGPDAARAPDPQAFLAADAPRDPRHAGTARAPFGS
jgi:hypothetical protein